MAAKFILLVSLVIYVCFNNVVSSANITPPGNAATQTHPNASPVQPPNKEQGDHLGVKSGGAGDAHYNHRGSPINNQRSPSYSPSTPNQAVSSYNRDAYGTGRDASGNPFLALSSDADFQVSAYFGQVFWGLLAVVLTSTLSLWLIRVFNGTDIVGGLVEKIKKSGATGKSLDLDRITNMVYSAIDTYGKNAVQEVKHLLEDKRK